MQAGKMVLQTEAVQSDCDSDGIPSSAVPSDHSSAVPSDDDTPASSAVPSDHDSDVSRPPVWTGIISPLDFAVKELGPLLQDGDLKSCGCPRGCWQAIAEDEEAVSLWRSFSDDFGQLKRLEEKQEVDAFLLDMLKHCGPNGGPPPQTLRGSTDAIFYVGKVPVCKRALKMFLSIGTSRMDRLLNHARQGGVTPPVDNRGGSHFSLTKSPEWFDADSWFCWAYHNIAEFIATMPMKETSLKAIEDLVPELSDFTADGKQRRRAHAARTDPSAPCHDVAQQLSDIEKLPVKFMHPASLATLYELYKKAADESDCSGSGPARGLASYSTWYRVYRKWSVVLKFRPSTSAHAGCNLCSRIKRFRTMAKSRKQAQLVSRAYAIHQSRVMRDRATFCRLFSSSEAYCRDGHVGATPVLALQLDAMDHAKFKAPRLANPSKETEALWRPSLQMIGGTTWGVSESWFLFDVTLKRMPICSAQ